MWIDSMRGFLILLVVVYHVIERTVVDPVIVDHDMVAGLAKLFTDGLRPLRMPLFFFLAGALASGAIRRDWGSLLKSRTAMYAWVVAAWTLLGGTVVGFARLLGNGGDTATSAYVDEFNFLWFLTALALYFPATKMIQSAPVAARYTVLGVAIALNLVFVDHSGVLQYGQILAYFVYFLAGNMWPRVLIGLGGECVGCCSRAWWGRVAGGLVMFVGAQAVDLVAGERTSSMLLVASAGAIMFAPPIFARFTGRWRMLQRAGGVTMPIYVIHPVIVGCVVASGGVQIVGLPLGLVYLFMFPVALLGVSWGLYLLLRNPAPWLFRLPASLQLHRADLRNSVTSAR